MRDFILADEVTNRRSSEHNFVSGDSSAPYSFEESLRDNSAKTFRKHGTNHILFSGGKHVNNAVDGFGGGAGMKSSKHEVSGFSGGKCESDSFWVTHLTDEDDIGVFTKGGTKRSGEALSVLSDFSLINK